MDERKAAIAAKRKKLEELRAAKKAREQARQNAPPESPRAATLPGGGSQVDVSKLVSDILGEQGGDKAGGSSQPGSPVKSTPSRATSRLRMRSRAQCTMSGLVGSISISPGETITYSKSVQTDAIPELEPKEEEQKAKVEEENKQEVVEQETADADEEDAKEEPEEPKMPELSEEEVSEIISHPDFQQFFDRTSRIVERALNETYDVTIDYAADEDGADGDTAGALKVRQKLDFFAPGVTEGRAVTCMDYSNKYPELLAVSYNANEDTPNEPDGIVLIWNAHRPQAPEFRFECQSAVLSTCFAPFSPHMVVGGTYSGQIVLWDNRAKHTPVQRSGLSAKAHTHPVYCMEVVGTQNAHNLITVSTDGKLCSWNLDMLNEPQETLDLNSASSKSVAATCVSFPQGDINNFVVGSEEANVYQAQRHGAKAGVGDIFEGHAGPITGVDFHKISGNADFSHLFLSSSADWSVHLWSYRSLKPLYSFEEAGDYVYDVKWSPAHPALFATADGAGRLDFWNINTDTEVPAARVLVDEGQHPVNRIKWGQNGNHLAAGTADGHVFVFDIGEKLAQPRIDEWNRLKDTLADIQQAAADVEQ